MGRSWDIPHVDWEPGKSEWLSTRNPEEIPRNSNSNCYEAVTVIQGLSLWESLSTHTALSFLLTNTLPASLLSGFVGIIFCKAKGPGPLPLTAGLVIRIWPPSLPGSPSQGRPSLPEIGDTHTHTHTHTHTRTPSGFWCGTHTHTHTHTNTIRILKFIFFLYPRLPQNNKRWPLGDCLYPI